MESLVAAVRAVLPNLTGPGVDQLKLALQAHEASTDAVDIAMPAGVESKDLAICKAWLEANPNAELVRSWYGSGDEGFAEEVEAFNASDDPPGPVAEAFERLSDACIETEAGIEHGDGGSVRVNMTRLGLTIHVANVEEVEQPTRRVVLP